MTNRKYIFVTPTISLVGGAQTYIYNKAKYLREHGWDVIAVHSDSAEILIPYTDLGVKIYTAPHLYYCTYVFNPGAVERIIQGIKDLTGTEAQEIVVESSCLAQVTWGERLAQELGGKHIIFLLQEDNPHVTELDELLIYKLQRRELATIKKEALKTLFSEMHLDTESAIQLTAIGCGRVVHDVKSPLTDTISSASKNVDYVIGSIGRLDKPFVRQMVNDLAQYMTKHQDKRFLIVFMGGAPTNQPTKSIKRVFDKIPNAECLITGYLYPLPESALGLVDVFVGTAGSVRVPYEKGVFSISYDTNDHRPIGLFGVTTNNSLYRGDDDPVDLETLLDDILLRKRYKRPMAKVLPEPDYSSHDEFLKQSTAEKDYFDINKINKLTPNTVKMRTMIRIIGPRSYTRLGKIKQDLTALF